MNIGDMIIRVAFFILFTWLYTVARTIPGGTRGELGAGLWPKFILIVLIIASGVSVIKELRRFWSGRGRDAEETETNPSTLSKDQTRRLILAIVVCAVYILLFQTVGYLISTTLLVAASMRLMQYPSIPKALIISVLVVVALTFFFGKVMYIPLPRGQWIFREMSYLLY